MSFSFVGISFVLRISRSFIASPISLVGLILCVILISPSSLPDTSYFWLRKIVRLLLVLFFARIIGIASMRLASFWISRVVIMYSMQILWPCSIVRPNSLYPNLARL